MADKLLDALQTEADLCRNEGATDIAQLLDEAVAEIQRLKQFEREMSELITIGLTDQGNIQVKAIAATEMSFEVITASENYQNTLEDICYVVPRLMRLDVDTAEMYDDAGRTHQRRTDLMIVGEFKTRYKRRLWNVDCDLLEVE